MNKLKRCLVSVLVTVGLTVITSLEVLAMHHQEMNGTLEQLLTLKFNFLGEKLSEQIEEIHHNSLSHISKEEILSFFEFHQKKEPNIYKVDVWVEKNATKEDLDQALLAAAYFPKEYDRLEYLENEFEKKLQDFRKVLIKEYPKKPSKPRTLFIHKSIQIQLAYSSHYGHPYVKTKLEELVDIIGKGAPRKEDDDNVLEEESEDATKRFQQLLQSNTPSNKVSLQKISLYFDVENELTQPHNLVDRRDLGGRRQSQRDIILNNLNDIMEHGPFHSEPTPLPPYRVEQIIEKWEDVKE